MRKFPCHRCGAEKYLVLHNGNDFPCPCCGCLYGSVPLPIPTIQPQRVLRPAIIDISQPIDKISAELMAYFLSNGRTVSEVARQMGITRATVYSKLKKYDLFHAEVSQDFKIHINAADFQAMGLRYRKSDRYCKL